MSPMPSGDAADQIKSVFFYPHAQGAAVSPASTTVTATNVAESVVMTRCSNAGSDPKCMATINLPAGTTAYYLNVRSLYRNSSLEVDGVAAGGGAVSFRGSVKVDVTAKAVDVLKRVRVQVSTEDTGGSMHNYGIETSESICKRYSVAPGYYTNESSGICP